MPFVNVQDQEAAEKISRCRTHLLLDHPWWGSLALRLKMIEKPDLPNLMRTNGTWIQYNPTNVKKLTDAECVGLIAHEVSHCALLHMFRMGGRNPKLWNVATDYAINGILTKAGIRIPEGGLLNEAFDGMSSEQIYALLRQDGNDGSESDNQPTDFEAAGGDGDGKGEGEGQQPGNGQQPNGGGQGQPPPQEGMSETDWQIAVEQVNMVAQKAGTLPAGIDRLTKEARTPRTDCWEALRRFISATQPGNYSWSTPNRRHLSNGLYLPGIVKENMAKIVVYVDTSGSITQDLLDLFGAHLTGIMHEYRPEALHVVYCDAEVAGEETFSPDDGAVIMKAQGGGGTAFQPAFDHIAEHPEFANEPPVAAIYLTDLYSSDVPKDPGYPVLWATTEGSTEMPPFGEIIRIPVA